MSEKDIHPTWFRRIEIGLLLMMTGVFIYALVEYLSPDGTAYKPLTLLLLSAAMMLQLAAGLTGERSRLAFYIGLAASMVLLAAAMLV